MKIKKFWEYTLLLCFAGYVYICLELLFRAKSDVSMMFTASICAIPMIVLNNIYSYELDFLIQIVLCALFSTGVEYIVGKFIVNQTYRIWDYRNMPFNIDGQICLTFTLVWAGISAIVIPLFDYIEYYVFDGTRPYYRIFGTVIWMKEKGGDTNGRSNGSR